MIFQNFLVVSIFMSIAEGLCKETQFAQKAIKDSNLSQQEKAR